MEDKQSEIYGFAEHKSRVPITFEAIWGILANGLADRCGFDDIRYSQEDYAKAKGRLMEEGIDCPCIEEVQAQMLVAGMRIELHMTEADEDEEWYALTLEGLMEGITRYDADENFDGNAEDVAKDDPDSKLDFYDYDAILQYACYGKYLIG